MSRLVCLNFHSTDDQCPVCTGYICTCSRFETTLHYVCTRFKMGLRTSAQRAFNQSCICSSIHLSGTDPNIHSFNGSLEATGVLQSPSTLGFVDYHVKKDKQWLNLLGRSSSSEVHIVFTFAWALGEMLVPGLARLKLLFHTDRLSQTFAWRSLHEYYEAAAFFESPGFERRKEPRQTCRYIFMCLICNNPVVGL